MFKQQWLNARELEAKETIPSWIWQVQGFTLKHIRQQVQSKGICKTLSFCAGSSSFLLASNIVEGVLSKHRTAEDCCARGIFLLAFHTTHSLVIGIPRETNSINKVIVFRKQSSERKLRERKRKLKENDEATSFQLSYWQHMLWNSKQEKRPSRSGCARWMFLNLGLKIGKCWHNLNPALQMHYEKAIWC